MNRQRVSRCSNVDPSRRGFTLAEVLIVFALATLLTVIVYRMWISATIYSVNLEERITVLRSTQIGLTHMMQELQRARRLLYPAPGGDVQAGLSYVTGEGEPVLISLENAPATIPVDDPTQRGGEVVRVNLKTGEKRRLMDRVLALQCRVPAVPSGRDSDVTWITVTVAGPGGRPLFLVTGAHISAPDSCCPLDTPPERLWGVE